jgi:hypothetical protein
VIGPQSPLVFILLIAGFGGLTYLLIRGRVLGLRLLASAGTRHGLVYLPPEYFHRSFAATRFPVVELLHGSPGTPTRCARAAGSPRSG